MSSVPVCTSLHKNNVVRPSLHSLHDLIPTLAALVEACSPTSLDSRTVPPETASIEAVADALIQLQAKGPVASEDRLCTIEPG